MSDDFKVLEFNKPTIVEEPSTVEITYLDGSKEYIYDSDAFGMAQDIPGFIIFWKDQPYKLLGFYNANGIRSFKILEKGEVPSD